MKILQKYAVFAQLLLGVFVFISSGTANADPTTNVARMSYIDGAVTYSPSGVDSWAYAKLNHPMITGDRLWVDAKARAELQLGSATFRLWSNTYLTLLNFNNQIAQFQLNQGSIDFHVYKTKSDKTYEIDTPNLVFTTYHSGDYRVDVSADGKTTTISINSGQGTVYDSKNVAYPVNAQKTYVYTGTDLSQVKSSPIGDPDEFDQWCSSREMRVHKAHKAISSKYVSSEAIGSEDLDNYGSWQSNETYGNVWVPNQVDPGWAPYSDGSWVWVDQYGWTWVDNAPWGFTPYHYGRWVYFEDHWSWVPGPVYQPPVYAPALVVFFEGNGFDIGVSFGGQVPGIGWFPLGPNDVYIPPYPYSGNYFNQINISNTVINNTIINNYYNNPDQIIKYSNRNAPGAITAMPVNSFVNSNPVNKALVKLPKNIAVLPVKHIAPLTPTVNSITGGGKPAKIKPSPAVLNRPAIAKTVPPAIAPFDPAKLAKHPGVPLPAQNVVPEHPGKPAAGGIVVPPPSGEIVKPDQLKPDHPNVQPLVPGHHESPAAGGIAVPHPPGVIVKPDQLKPDHPNVQPLVPDRHEKPAAGGISGGTVVPHPPGVIVKPDQLKPEHHNIQPLVPEHHETPAAGGIAVPHPPGVIVKPQEHTIQPSQPNRIRPEIPAAGVVQHPSEIRPQQQIVQPRVQEQQQARIQQMQQQGAQEQQQQRMQQMQQQRAQEQQQQRMQQMQQQRAQEQQQARMQQMQQQRAQEQQQARMQQLQQQRAQEQQAQMQQQRAQEQQAQMQQQQQIQAQQQQMQAPQQMQPPQQFMKQQGRHGRDRDD